MTEANKDSGGQFVKTTGTSTAPQKYGDHATTQQFVTSADGTKIAVNVTGEGPPLVICPGSLSLTRDWQAVAQILAPNMTVYAIDRRGHGDSGNNPSYDDPNDPAYTIELEQQDLAAVLELAGEDATLLGHSYGGIVALGLSLEKQPKKLILYEPPLGIDAPIGGSALEPYATAIAEGDHDAALMIGVVQVVKAPEEEVNEFRGSSEWEDRAEFAPGWLREIRASDEFGGELGRFAAITCPTLVVTGSVSLDWLLDAARRLCDVLPDARLVEIPGQAHDAHFMDPPSMAAPILDFAV